MKAVKDIKDIKMVAVDVDGTFVRSDYTYDVPRFKQILERMDRAGAVRRIWGRRKRHRDAPVLRLQLCDGKRSRECKKSGKIRLPVQ